MTTTTNVAARCGVPGVVSVASPCAVITDRAGGNAAQMTRRATLWEWKWRKSESAARCIAGQRSLLCFGFRLGNDFALLLLGATSTRLFCVRLSLSRVESPNYPPKKKEETSFRRWPQSGSPPPKTTAGK